MNARKRGAIQPSPISLGQLLVAGGFITTATLQQALSTQRWSRRRLGEVLVQRDILSSTEKLTLLKLQKKLAKYTLTLKPDASITEDLQLSLGQLLLDSGEISQQH
jgi:hypothetical protein